MAKDKIANPKNPRAEIRTSEKPQTRHGGISASRPFPEFLKGTGFLTGIWMKATKGDFLALDLNNRPLAFAPGFSG
jgi:hypothetical protein